MQCIQLHDARIRKLAEIGNGETAGPIETFAGMTVERFRQLQEAADPRCFQPGTGLPLFSTHSFVIETGGKNILIDTCAGEKKSRSGVVASLSDLKTDYLGNLATMGLSPADIDMVMCTHLHCDHVGWNTRLENGQWVPTFENATYIMSRTEVEHCEGLLATGGPLSEMWLESYKDSVLPVIDGGQAKLVEPGSPLEHDLGGGLWLEDAAGHTPGTMLIHLQRGDGHAVFTGDIFHHPIQIQDSSLNLGFVDHDPVAASHQRERIAGAYTNSSTILLAAHFPPPTSGRIIGKDKDRVFGFLDPA